MVIEFKKYEIVDTGAPKIVDYAICDYEDHFSYGIRAISWAGNTAPKEEIVSYMNSTVGQITEVVDIPKKGWRVVYPNSQDSRIRDLHIDCDKIKHWSENKKELLILLSTGRFGL